MTKWEYKGTTPAYMPITTSHQECPNERKRLVVHVGTPIIPVIDYVFRELVSSYINFGFLSVCNSKVVAV